MNWSDEDIDTLFRTGANDIKPVYKSSFWDEMEAMLPVEKKRKAFPWFWTSLSAVITLIGLTSFNWFFSSEKPSDLHAIQLSQSNDALVSKQHKRASQMIKTNSINSEFESKSNSKHAVNSTKTTDKNSRKFNKNIPQTLLNSNLNQVPLSFNNSTNQIIKESNELPTTFLEVLPISWENKIMSSGKNALIDLFSYRKKRSFYVELGVGAGQSFVKNVDASPQINITAGAGISYFPSRFGVSLGAQFNVIQLSDLTLNRRSKVYCYTSTDYLQRLQYKQLYTVSIPINLIYKTTRSRFEIGISPSYIAQTQLVFTSSINGEMDQTGKALNTDLGLNRFNILGQVGYHVTLSKNWKAGVRMTTWLTQPTQDGVFESKSTRFPTQGQFSLRYSL